MIFMDSHTHLDLYAPEEIPGVLSRARDAEVRMIICAGTTAESSRHCIQLSSQHSSLLAGVGIHPMQVESPVGDETYSTLRELALSSSKIACISEIGLDFLPTSPDKQLQTQAFRQQIRLAKELHLPIIFHSRESHPEVFNVLREEYAGDVGGVMHYFQADQDTAQEAIDLGFLISLARPLNRLPGLQEVARELSLEHIVLETDSAPQPFKKYRHNWTEPRHVKDVAQKLAELKGIDLEEVAQVTTTNLCSLLKLDRLPEII